MSIVKSITDVFSEIGTWISDAINDLLPMFYNAETGLTFLGTLAVCGLAFSVVFLLISLIQNFLHFRG
jgi:hypothetical protein